MTDDTVVICRRCGFGNVPGDQFCGSCGAFLEWEGEPAGEPDAGAPVDAEAAGLAALAGGPATTSAGAGPESAPTQVWTPAPAPVAPPAAGLVRCPACGIANPGTRNFCQSCGTPLGGAKAHAEPTAASIAAALGSVPAGASTSPVPPAPPRGVPARPADAKSRGIPGWLIALAGLGIVAGVAIVVASTLLRGEGPATGASAAPVSAPPSAPAGAGGTAGPGESAAPGDSGAPGESAAAPEPGSLVLTGATASSVVGDRAKFQPGQAIDGDPKTAWQEGRKAEKGQWIEVTFGPARVDSVRIWNGYQASKALYNGNLRPRDVVISVDGAERAKVRLKDSMKAQTVELGGITGATSVRITILSTYGSKKTSVNGTPFDDAAISEIAVIGVAGG